MSTTPFELRFEIYNTALDRLKEKYHMELEVWRVRTSKGYAGETPPIFPSVEKIIKEANVVYEFVQTK